MTDNDQWLRIQEQARKDAEAGRQRSNEHTSNGRTNDLYQNTYSDTKKGS